MPPAMRKTQLRKGERQPSGCRASHLPEGAGMEAAAEEILFSFTTEAPDGEPVARPENGKENDAKTER